ncbi:hypothetical protein QQX98_003633 [Neonectria punicea]|uniref:C2H2-type domain-containing protein n=1 Tax=Neonectria punicea TaxID=979145 RepID=A0ABR1HCR0_9HYPO
MKRASSKKPDNGKRKVTGREDSETDDDAGDGHKEDQQGSERTVHGDQKPKDHLYRSHRQPKYRCGRCWQPFKDEQGYLEHQRTPEPCELQKMEYVEGFDAAQEQSLRSRKRANLEPSEAEKWKRVFTILFPHVLNDDIPSPFYEHNEMPQRPSGTQDSNSDYLAQCEDYMVKEVPQRLRQALGRELAQDLTIVEERLRRKAGECVKTLLEEVFQELRQKLRQVGSHAHGNSNARSKQSEVGDPLISVSESNPSEVSMLPPEGEYEAWLAGCGFDAADPLSLFGDAEICFHDGALLDNLMKSGGDGDGEGNKPLDSTYGSNSSG